MSILVEHVSFGYTLDHPVLRDLDLSIPDGESVLLAGPNGAGKSTLLKLLNGILKPGDGRITVDGMDTASTPTATLASRILVTFQNPADQLFASTVLEEVMFGPTMLRRPDPRQRGLECLELFGLAAFAKRHPYDLAPSQRKLLTLAAAVAGGSSIMAFDEPTASLSQTERAIFSKAWEYLRTMNRTVLVVSHDFEFFLPLVSRVVVLAGQTIQYSGSPDEFLRNRAIARSTGLAVPVVVRLVGMA